MDKITVIYEDKNFLAVNKPAGVLVHEAHSMKHEAKNNKKNTARYTLHSSEILVDWLLKNYPEVKSVGDAPEIRPGIVHRLDKETSGVVLIARNQKYFDYLKKLFQARQIKKTYLALVWGRVVPKTGTIEKSIRLKPGTIKRTVWQGKMEKPAITEYKVLKYFKYNSSLTIVNELLYFSFLRVMLKTGRTHQIRVHLASVSHPIVGDTLYGRKNNLWGLKRLFLHAESLEFSLEGGKRIKIEAGLPEELRTIIDDLRFKM